MNEPKLSGNEIPELRVLLDNLNKQSDTLLMQANKFYSVTTLFVPADPATDGSAKDPNPSNYTEELRMLIRKLDEVIALNDNSFRRFSKVI